MAKLKQGEKRVQLSFQRPEDVALFERLSAMAYERRYDLPTFLLLALQEAFPLPGRDEVGHPVSPEWTNNTPAETGMDPYQSHHMMTYVGEGRTPMMPHPSDRQKYGYPPEPAPSVDLPPGK